MDGRRVTARVAPLAAIGLLLLQTVVFAADPLRVVLLVDSSANMSAMLTEFRAAITTFIDNVPADVEMALISTGGQLRIRVPPTTDRERLHKAAAAFASDGGANSILETMLESDQRLLRVRNRRPVFVVISTDAPSRGDPDLDGYNRFMLDFVSRRGRAHGIVIRTGQMGLASEIVANLTNNTDGLYQVLNVANSLANRLREIAEEVAAED